MPANILNGSQLATISFIDGLKVDGTIAAQDFADWNEDDPATYDASNGNAHKWDNDSLGNTLADFSSAGTAGGTVTYAFNATETFTAVQEQAFVSSLTLWSDEANINFVQSATPSTADVLFSVATDTGTYESNAPYYLSTVGSSSVSSELSPGVEQGGHVDVVFDTSGEYGTLGSFTSGAGYSYSALIHEIGHVLGLGHAGPYNESASGSQQETAYDSRQWSVMSYFSPQDSTVEYYSQYTVIGTNWTVSQTTANPDGSTVTVSSTAAPETPMPLDILAAQQLYGTPVNTALSGGQVFGFHCNITDASETFFDFTKNVTPVITLWDAGTGNTLDLSGFFQAAIVNLNPGTFSSVGGLTNNIGIAYGTAIDTAIGGSGGGTFILNADSDHIVGGAGNNVVIFSGTRADYTLVRSGTAILAEEVGGNITDTLQNVQSLQFTDGTVASSTVASPITVTSTRGLVTITDAASTNPFTNLVITDPNAGQTETATVSLNNTQNGALTDPNAATDGSRTTNGLWTLSGSATQVAAALDSLVFIPKAHEVAPGSFVKTPFAATVTDSAGQSASTSRIVTTTAVASPITMTSTRGLVTITDAASTNPFTNLVITDPNAGQTETATVSLNNTQNGALTDPNAATDGSRTTNGLWTLSGSATQVAAALDSLVFTPGAYEVAPGSSVMTAFTASVTDSAGQSASVSSTVTVDNTSAESTAGQVQLASGLSLADLNTQTLQLVSSPTFIVGMGGALQATTGVDVFEFGPGTFGQNIVNGFDPTSDILELSRTQFANVAVVLSDETPVGNGVQVVLDGSHSILLLNVAPSSLTAANLRFV